MEVFQSSLLIKHWTIKNVSCAVLIKVGETKIYDDFFFSFPGSANFMLYYKEEAVCECYKTGERTCESFGVEFGVDLGTCPV